ncbi:hypothetical protein [uncultured Sphingomonas sp.]|uniref:hypothetical protein n=1 Tax=uncultured Sphingomonas sp. TaxID=158754 RepID=UPI0025F0279A|nr:hypothetical protein [uncultured Sphingomonas sp.]
MPDPSIQRLFDTPLIDGQVVLVGADDDRLIATAIALADRYTADMTYPATPRFVWTATCRRVAARGPIGQTGAYWTAAFCLSDDGSTLVIDDPRSLTLSAIPAGVAFADPDGATGDRCVYAAKSGVFVLLPGYVRAEFQSSTGACDWSIVSLFARRTQVLP